MGERTCSTSVSEPYGEVIRAGEDAKRIAQKAQIAITPAGTWLCLWTQASTEDAADQSVMLSRSADSGRTWDEPFTIEGPTEGPRVASWVVPFVVPHTGRIYAFFWWCTQPDPLRDAGHIYVRYSDDDGLTWSRRYPPWPRRYPLPRPRHSGIDEEGHQIHGWNCAPPAIMPNGKVVFTFTKIRPSTITPWLQASHKLDLRIGNPADHHACLWHTQAFLMVGHNLLGEQDPQNLDFSVLPDGATGVHMRMPKGGTCGDELRVVALATGEWLATFRTAMGCIYFATSADCGRTWTMPQPLRFCPGGPVVPHPCAPYDLARLSDGRFILLFYNNRGDANGGAGPCDQTRVRTPLWAVVGRELTGATTRQRIVWGSPRVVIDNHIDVAHTELGEMTEVGDPHFFEWCGRCFIAYSDRRRHVLINEVPPELVDDFGLPT